MTLAFAPPLPPNAFRLAPATHPAPARVTLLTYDQRGPSFCNRDPDSPHVPAPPVTPVSVERFLGVWLACAGVLQCCSGVRKALTPSVLVNSSWGFGWTSAGVSALCLGALKALTQAALVKRLVLASVRCTSAFDQRVEVQCWPGTGSAKRALGFLLGGCWGRSTGSEKRFSQIFFRLLQCTSAPVLRSAFCVLGAGCWVCVERIGGFPCLS